MLSKPVRGTTLKQRDYVTHCSHCIYRSLRYKLTLWYIDKLVLITVWSTLYGIEGDKRWHRFQQWESHRQLVSISLIQIIKLCVRCKPSNLRNNNSLKSPGNSWLANKFMFGNIHCQSYIINRRYKLRQYCSMLPDFSLNLKPDVTTPASLGVYTITNTSSKAHSIAQYNSWV